MNKNISSILTCVVISYLQFKPSSQLSQSFIVLWLVTDTCNKGGECLHEWLLFSSNFFWCIQLLFWCMHFNISI